MKPFLAGLNGLNAKHFAAEWGFMFCLLDAALWRVRK
jgi:hypothetical protein